MAEILGALALLLPLAFQQGEAVQLPPHDYAFVDATAHTEPAWLLAAVRQAIDREIQEAGLSEPGYPVPCHITLTPILGEPARYDVTCETDSQDDAEPDGLRLDKEGRFLELGIVDFPDSRVWVMEIYAVPHLPFAGLRGDTRWSIPRVVIRFPHVDPAWYPAIWSVLERAINEMGAKVIERR